MEAKDRKHRKKATSGTGFIKLDNRKLLVGEKMIGWFW